METQGARFLFLCLYPGCKTWSFWDSAVSVERSGKGWTAYVFEKQVYDMQINLPNSWWLNCWTDSLTKNGNWLTRALPCAFYIFCWYYGLFISFPNQNPQVAIDYLQELVLGFPTKRLSAPLWFVHCQGHRQWTLTLSLLASVVAPSLTTFPCIVVSFVASSFAAWWFLSFFIAIFPFTFPFSFTPFFSAYVLSTSPDVSVSGLADSDSELVCCWRLLPPTSSFSDVTAAGLLSVACAIGTPHLRGFSFSALIFVTFSGYPFSTFLFSASCSLAAFSIAALCFAKDCSWNTYPSQSCLIVSCVGSFCLLVSGVAGSPNLASLLPSRSAVLKPAPLRLSPMVRLFQLQRSSSASGQ